jgi:GNAT superfamily N-acetyltransferase
VQKSAHLRGRWERSGIDVNRMLVPLSMSSLTHLPEQCRACVSWEVPAAAAVQIDGDQAAFEKEVWFSGVMLTWGSAGQIVMVDDQPAGFALYAPPTAVPGALGFPSGPVSPDAVLLTTARILPEFQGQGLARYLMNGVVSALTSRGVRAIELFGVEDRAPAGPAVTDQLRDNAGGNAVPRCVLPANFARAVGFVDVQPHHRYPRLRFELASGIGWKEQVEAALEQLFTVISVPATPAAEPALV